MWHRVLKIIWASLLLNFCILYSYILYLKCPLDMLLYQGLYLKNGATKSKNKGTFFSRTFKVWESKVPLLIDFMPSKRRYGRFVILSPGHGHNIKQNGHISETRQRNKKPRALSFLQLLPRTLKVGGNKVPLFFCFMAPFPRYGRFVEKHVQGTKSQNGHSSAQKAYFAKIRTLCFLEL